ncbi:Gag-polypeptide of LTR copia-type [Sesbania bispinosa]|nr:Gag-polypeptide of LTR copia-type [Sesbania bispinosa]
MGENKAEGSATSLVEGPALPITGHKLNGQNYPQWVRSVKIFLQGKGKEGYITGDSKSPKKGDPNLNKWQLENMKETYSNVDNTSAVFEIKSILHDLRQVRREESRRKVMLGKSVQPHPLKAQQWQQGGTSLVHLKRKIGPGAITARNWVTLRTPAGSFMAGLQRKQTKNLDSRGNTAEGEQTYPIEVVESQLLGFELAESAPNAEPADCTCSKESCSRNAEPAETAPAAEETAVANAEPAETAPAAEETAVDAVETAPTEARERTASQQNQGPATQGDNCNTSGREGRE